MMLETTAFTIRLGQRYRDVLSDCWPVLVTPQADELLSSWLHRLAHANGISPRGFAQVLGLNAGMWSPRLDLALPDDVAGLLSAHTGISSYQLRAMTLIDAVPKELLLSLRNSTRFEGSTWLQFCPACLAEDEHPYFRRRWRLATRVTCLKHGCRLRDRCTVCHSHVAAFDDDALLPQHYCAGCGFDLRQASRIHAYPETKAFNCCLDAICTFDAITGSPFGPTLIRQLLAIPRLTGDFATKTLVSLSTAARTRCALYLNPPDGHLPSIENEDHEKAAVDRLRCRIPPLGDHRAWIELLTKVFAAARTAPTSQMVETSVPTLRHLLAAYAKANAPLFDRRLRLDTHA